VTDGRTRTAGALGLTGLVIIATMAPAVAAPTYDQARERAAALGATAERLSSGQARLTADLTRSERELTRVENRIEQARKAGREARTQVARLLIDDATTGGGELVHDLFAGSEDLDIELVAESETNLMRTERRSGRAVDRLEERQDELQMQIRRLDVTRDRQRPQVATAQQRAAQAAELVDRIEEERASRAAEREEAEAAEAAETSSGTSAVVDYALAQVGDPYVWGAVGPDSFDCSGFTMAAWAQAGVSLPHNSGAQMGSGTPVSTDALMPGDLVFYYSPVSHVGIYVGNGQIVHAGNPAIGVTTAPLHQMPLVGAVRPG
jgi:cell wall-associated NlpC family hydrolase